MGLGFGRAHTGIDMNSVDFLSVSSYNLHDSYSDSESRPTEDTDLGGTFDLKNLGYKTDSANNAMISYIRAFNTGDQYDAVISPDTSFTLSVAWGSSTIHNHGGNKFITTISISSSTPVINNGNSTINFPNTNSTDTGDSDSTDTSDSENFWFYHGIGLTIIWTALNFFGYASARFFRYNPMWEWLHLFFSGLFSFLAILIMAYSVIKSKYYIY